MGCHFLLQWIFLTQGSNPSLLHWQANSLPLCHLHYPKVEQDHLTQSLIYNELLTISFNLLNSILKVKNSGSQSTEWLEVYHLFTL